MNTRFYPAISTISLLVVISGCKFSFNSDVAVDTTGGTPPAAVSLINDTGITLCGDYAYSDTAAGYTGSGTHNNNVDCAAAGATQTTAGIESGNGGDAVPAGQDAVYGRDALAAQGQLSKVGGGAAGFDFTKLDNNGDDLPASATSWHCVRDNVTGLIWEAKQITPAENLHDPDDTYTWYQTSNNNGDPGTQDGSGTCFGYSAADAASYCNTSAFAARVNNSQLCGYSDWRVPSSEELLSIVHKGRFNPAIDTGYFPYTKSDMYWASSLNANDTGIARFVFFINGDENFSFKFVSLSVKLVRGGQ